MLAAAPRLLVWDLEDSDAEVSEHEAGGELADAALHVDQEAPEHLEDADMLQQEILVCTQRPLQSQALLLSLLLLLLFLLFFLFLAWPTLLLFLCVWGPHFEVAVLSNLFLLLLALLPLALLSLVGGFDPSRELPLNSLPDERAQALDEVLVGGSVANAGEGQEDDLAGPRHHLDLWLSVLGAVWGEARSVACWAGMPPPPTSRFCSCPLVLRNQCIGLTSLLNKPAPNKHPDRELKCWKAGTATLPRAQTTSIQCNPAHVMKTSLGPVDTGHKPQRQ